MLDKPRIKKLIAESKIKEALATLPDTTEVLALKARLSALEKADRLGTIGTSEATVTRNKIVSDLLELLDVLEDDTSNPIEPIAGNINFSALETAYNKADWAEVIGLLDDYYGNNPNPQYSTLRNTIEHYLLQGLMPPPATLQGLHLFINQLKKNSK